MRRNGGQLSLKKLKGLIKEHGGTGTQNLADDVKLYFGDDNEASIEYDENGADFLIISGSTASGVQMDGPTVYISGKLGVGVDSPTYALELPNTSGEAGQARANAFVTYSSKSLKKNINQIEQPLNIVENLTGVTFDWKDNNKREIGLIAEEVHKILPEIVAYEENKPAALDYPKLTALLIECVKELKTKIDFLEKKVIPHGIDIKKES